MWLSESDPILSAQIFVVRLNGYKKDPERGPEFREAPICLPGHSLGFRGFFRR